MKTRPHKKQTKADRSQSSLSLLTGAALLLPGLLQSAPVLAADDDEVDFGYSHYQESGRQPFFLNEKNQNTGVFKNALIPKIAPIEVDSIHGSARTSLSDRLKFGFNYLEDTWSGATPYGSAPETSGAYGNKHPSYAANGEVVNSHASPMAAAGSTLIDSHGQFMHPNPNGTNPLTGKATYSRDRLAHVMGYASPETRKQGDFKLAYEWDQAAANVGGGVSTERDYDSRFVNLGGKLDFNQKRTTLDFNQSYTSSDINAFEATFPGAHPQAIVLPNGSQVLKGNRQDWTGHLGLTQIVNPDAVLNAGVGYSRNTGLLENPYKVSWFGGLDPAAPLVDGFRRLYGLGFYERRPDARNLVNGNLGWTQYVAPLDAALHVNYQYSHDDWAIASHTLDANWVQPLGQGWTLTPRVRYYSQSAANFYQAYFVVGMTGWNTGRKHYDLPDSFSSDQRLSGFGSLSGGLTLSKQFARGVSLETGFEYYTHQGGLKLGGGGEQAFADYDYWQANANLKLNLGAMGSHLGGGAGDTHGRHAEHSSVPAGLMFAHTLNHAGEMMAGYRYQHSRSAGDWLHGDHSLTLAQAAVNACPGALRTDADGNPHFDGPCPDMQATDMTQSMHMLELMYAFSDRLTVMLMPQFMDMDMTMQMAKPTAVMDHDKMAPVSQSQIGGIGDTGAYALVTLFDAPGQHVHASLGGTAPTGDVAQKQKVYGLDKYLKDYSMQLGSGTWDLKPSLTYTGKALDWSWGGQLGGTWRAAARNASGYKLGDLFETSVWGGYDWTHWLSSTLRLSYTWQGSIKGRLPYTSTYNSITNTCNKANFTYVDNYDDQGNPIGDPVLHVADYNACLVNFEFQKRQQDAIDHKSSQDYPQNYGGHYVDLGLGISATIPDGAFAGHKLAFEWQQPMYTNVNGYQLNRDHFLTFTWSVGF